MAKHPDSNPAAASNSTPLVFEAEVSSRLRWRGLRRFIWLRYRVVLLAGLVVPLLLLLYAASLPSSMLREVIGALGGFCLILWFFLIFFLTHREGREQRVTVGVPQRFHISRRQLEIESQAGHSVLHWFAVNKAYRYADMWLIMLGMQSCLIIPRASMSNAVDQLIEEMTSAGMQAGRCPKCGYALRGLVSDRCPECGAEISTLARELASSQLDSLPAFNPQSLPELNAEIESISAKTVIAIREYNLRQWLRISFAIVVSTGLLVVINTVWLHVPLRFMVGLGLFVWALISFSMYAAMVKVIQNYLARAEKLESDVMQIRVTADGYQLSSSKGVDQRRWEAVKRVKKLRRALAITYVSGHSAVIPSVDLSDELLTCFLTRGRSLRTQPVNAG